MNLNRRELLEMGLLSAAAFVAGPGISLGQAANRASAQDLLRFPDTGKLTLLHFADCHAQLLPVYFREPDTNLGVGAAIGQPPHLTNQAFLSHFGIADGSPEAYAFSAPDYIKLAHEFGAVGGMAHMATVVKHVRDQRGADNVLLLDSGDTWQGSYTSMVTEGDDMIQVANLLGVDAMTAHWEFTYGAEKVKENIEKLNFSFLAHNVKDSEWEEPVFKPHEIFEKGGAKVAVIGQVFPYTPIANPRRLIPNWSMGIQEKSVQEQVDEVRSQGATVVVLLSHNGMDVDLKLASRVSGIDVILGGHTHDAIPHPTQVHNSGGITLVCNSGSNGKFLSRMDLDVDQSGLRSWQYRLIPILSQIIPPDAEMAALIEKIRRPHEAELNRVIGHNESLLYRRGSFNGTFDDLICQALTTQMDAEISLSPGFRWGTSLLPGQPVTMEAIYNQTAITYPNIYRRTMTGQQIKVILEDVADNLFNPDPYRQQGGDMVRVGGMRYAIRINAPIGQRLQQIEVGGKPLELGKEYVVSGWASMGEVEGPPVWEVVKDYVGQQQVIRINPGHTLKGVS
ncbi:MAG: thiosulfohydrolase SoxB [Magnetococcales bacterium]|nr:thiosulfohydrolase SoxB [Magnetococcales bacterium]